ncbi:hypothetical protein ATANTOWER_000121 [Ataeniobius toweri]|uniref:Uncharacterized protein n=1 Tax=Ataeniobius toweri TaxID=208326 RepID=A0ABU7B4L3_9TELE|nr:hypothetical protein [Ataeniobius toweri]
MISLFRNLHEWCRDMHGLGDIAAAVHLVISAHQSVSSSGGQRARRWVCVFTAAVTYFATKALQIVKVPALSAGWHGSPAHNELMRAAEIAPDGPRSTNIFIKYSKLP